MNLRTERKSQITKEKLNSTIDLLKAEESLSNFRFEIDRYGTAIDVVHLNIENEHRSFDKDYSIMIVGDDLYSLIFTSSFDYRDTFDEKIASDLISNDLAFDIYKNKLSIFARNVKIEDLAETIVYLASKLEYFG